jgi:hypothetical protein
MLCLTGRTERRRVRRIWLASWLGLLCSCAGDYVARSRDIRSAYQSGDYGRALTLLNREAKGPEIDRLLVLLDRGMVLHAAGRYQESIGVLAEADQLSQQLDFVSVSEEAKALLSSERERAYRGEDFEKLMISVLQALNYAELGKDEDALVEVRRVNERIHKMIVDENKPYERLAIARYLGGVLYEDQGEWDSAFIDYADAWKLKPELGPLAEPLIRLAKKTRREDAYRELREKYPDIAAKPLAEDEGQIVVVVEAGLSPQKVSTQREYQPGKLAAVPVYHNRWYPTVASVRVGSEVQSAVTITSIQQVARVHLDDRVGRMLAKSLAGTALKAGVAAGAAAATKREEVGWLTFLLLSATTNPDLRSWLSLPAEFQVARFRAKPGKYPVNVEQNGVTTECQVEVKPRRIALAVVRRY